MNKFIGLFLIILITGCANKMKPTDFKDQKEFKNFKIITRCTSEKESNFYKINNGRITRSRY